MAISKSNKVSYRKAIVGNPPRPVGIPDIHDIKYGEFGVNAALGLVYTRKRGYLGDPFNLAVDLEKPVDTIIQLASMGVSNYGDFIVHGDIVAENIQISNGDFKLGDNNTYIEFGDEYINFFVDTNEIVNFLSNEVNYLTQVNVLGKSVITDAANIGNGDGYGLFTSKVSNTLNFRKIKAGSNIEIDIDEDGSLLITASGDIEDFEDLFVENSVTIGKDECTVFSVENGKVGIGDFYGDMEELLHIKHGNVRIDHGHLYLWGRLFVKDHDIFREIRQPYSDTVVLNGDYTIDRDDLRKNFQIKTDIEIVITVPSAIEYEGFEFYIQNLATSGSITINSEAGTSFIASTNYFANKYDWCRIYNSNIDGDWYGMI